MRLRTIKGPFSGGLLHRRRQNSKVAAKTVLGPDLEVKGNFDLNDDLDIYTEVTGNVKVRHGHLYIAHSAKIKGDVYSDSARVEGRINGNINCLGLLELGATADITGSIACLELSVAAGATIKGRVDTSEEVSSL